MLCLGLRYQIVRRMRAALIRNASLSPAVKPRPQEVNNNAIAGSAWRRYLKIVDTRFPIPPRNVNR